MTTLSEGCKRKDRMQDRMEERQKTRECVRTGCRYPPLVSSSKPEVQARERVSRSFLCRLNLLLPIFHSVVYIASVCSASFPLSCQMCASILRFHIHSRASLPSCFLPTRLSPPELILPELEVRLWQYVDLLLTVAFEQMPGGLPWPRGEMCHEKSCQAKIPSENLPALTEQSGRATF